MKYWSRNHELLDNEDINITFLELLQKSDKEVTEWINFMRSRVVEIWDRTGNPPLNGKDAKGIITDMSRLYSKKASKLEYVDLMNDPESEYYDESQPEGAVIINNSPYGHTCNQFFPTMMKAKINYQTNATDGEFTGYSVYDYFANSRFETSMQKGCRRHFLRDSFYAYSQSVEKRELIPTDNAVSWVKLFLANQHTEFSDKGIWFSPIELGKSQGTGYTGIDGNKYLALSFDEYTNLLETSNVPTYMLRNVNPEHLTSDYKFAIRLFDKSVRIFPDGFRAFRIGYIQVAVNFPPMIAKYLYEKYTEHIDDQDKITVYDPSAGWGGRILGCMAAEHDSATFHYVGTDPNSDNYDEESGKTRYEIVADFFNENVRDQTLFDDTNTYDVYRSGSEDIEQFDTFDYEFDMVFTSPPYFNREGYSDDEDQSLKKFPLYEDWKKGYLYPTLDIAAKRLKNDRYLLWNIADILTKDGYIPLEVDSREYLQKLGLVYMGIEKMGLANMPGANRLDENGRPRAKNFCAIEVKSSEKGSGWRKFEPVHVFYKP